MSTTPLLTICIPTYRRVDYLSQCLDGLAKEDLSDVEIIIRDNDSGDETESVLRGYQATMMRLRYEISVINEGPDRNFGKLLGMATGDYAWLLGDDDVVTPGSVAAIKQELRTRQPLLLQLGYIQGSSTLEHLHTVSPVRAGVNDRGSLVDIATYVEAQPNVSLLFAFISSFVFKRSCWDHGEAAEKWYGSNYVHLYQMHSALATAASPTVAHLDRPGVVARGNIPNYITANVGGIMWLDACTLADVCRTIYGSDPAIRRAFSRVFHKTYSLRTIASVLAQTGKPIDELTASALTCLGFSRLQLQLAAWLGRPFLRNIALTLVGKR